MLSDVMAQSIGDAIFHNVITTGLPLADLGFTADGSASPLSVALHTGMPGIGNAQTSNEATFGGYSRLTLNQGSTNWPRTGSRVYQNGGLLSFGPKSDTGTQEITWASVGSNTSNRVIAQAPLGVEDPKPFTVTDLTNDDIQCASHGYVADDRVVLIDVVGSALPDVITEGTVYWVIATGLSANVSFRISATQGGGAINFGARGSGYVAKVVPKLLSQNDKLDFEATGSNRITFTF